MKAIVYHGSENKFNNFRFELGGTQQGYIKNAMHFTSKKENAEYYGWYIYEVLLDIPDNKVVEVDAKNYEIKSVRFIVEKVKEENLFVECIVVKNILDGGIYSDIYVVFNKKYIKKVDRIRESSILKKSVIIETYLIKKNTKILLENNNILYDHFEYFNARFFNSTIELNSISFSKLPAGIGGLYKAQSKIIEINEDNKNKSEDLIDSILLHEMIHAYTMQLGLISGNKYHGREFKKMVDDINRQTNNKYRIGYTDVSMALDNDNNSTTQIVYFMLGLYQSTLGVQSLRSPIQIISEKNYSPNGLRPFLEFLKNIKDNKYIALYEVEVNNSFLTYDYLEKIIDEINNGYFGFAKDYDKYILKMMKQSKKYKLLATYDWKRDTFIKE